MPRLLTHTFQSFSFLLFLALAGCASLDKYSFETFGNPKQRQEVYAGQPRSDRLALIYADYVAQLLEGRSTGARLTREGSDSTLVAGAALAAAQETLEISAETIAGIGLGTVILRELQGIFNARGRSEAFADAAYLIRQAQSEYRQYNPNPSPRYLTENGAILVSRVDAALHAARKSLNGRLPGLLDLQQATQPMTEDGADRESSGTPQTMFTASGVVTIPRKREVRNVTAEQQQGLQDQADSEKKTGVSEMRQDIIRWRQVAREKQLSDANFYAKALRHIGLEAADELSLEGYRQRMDKVTDLRTLTTLRDYFKKLAEGAAPPPDQETPQQRLERVRREVKEEAAKVNKVNKDTAGFWVDRLTAAGLPNSGATTEALFTAHTDQATDTKKLENLRDALKTFQ